MDIKKKKLLHIVDHTLLTAFATTGEIQDLCHEASRAEAFSVCISPSYVTLAKKLLLGRKVKVCTVVGFPNGYSTTKTKLFETEDALTNGADEIDMVINLGFVKNKEYNKLLNEITEIKKICKNNVLKVIIENCYLTTEEKIDMCKIVTDSGANYIKTSTGFGSGGATFEDVRLIRRHIGKDVKIKAAGGVSNFEIAQSFFELGVSRIGSSKLAKLAIN